MAQLNARSPQEPPLLRIEPFKGINLAVTPTQIDNSQSPDMLNVHTDERGALTKRTGYERVIPNPISESSVNGLYVFQKEDGTEQFLFSQGGKLYTTDVMPGHNTQQPALWTDDDLTRIWGD